MKKRLGEKSRGTVLLNSKIGIVSGEKISITFKK
jgi:hypothetical protein